MTDLPDETQLRPPAAKPTPPPADPEAVRPVAIPGIQLGDVLGEGGMARVHEALDLGFSPPRRVAVKLMSPALSADPEFRIRFEREASIVADFRHDNVVHVYASGEAEGEKFLVMEYLSGGSLADRLKRGPLALGEAVSVALQLADALAYSHSRDIVHRDFKPGNVLFTADGKPVLTDFGVAKVTSSKEASMTQHAAVIGAPRYMAPEQERGEPVTDRADVYSWALTLFEMLTARQPLARCRVVRDAADADALIADLSGVPPQVARLIARSLSIDPASRPAASVCADELAAMTVERFARSAGETARDGASRIGKRGLWLGVGGVVLVGAVALLAWEFLRGGAPPAPVADPEARGERRAASVPMPVVALPVVRAPTSTRIFVGSEEIRGSSATLPVGLHQLAAIAPRHYGQYRALTVNESSNPPIEVQLLPVVLPDAEEHERFLDLADAPTLVAADIETLQEASLQTVIRLRYLRQTSDFYELSALETQMATLASLGDERAAVAQYLSDSLQRGNFDLVQAQAMLSTASQEGDAMASFFVAVAMRDALHATGAPIAATSEDFRAYCRQMRLAVQQGWGSVASMYLNRDSCPSS